MLVDFEKWREIIARNFDAKFILRGNKFCNFGFEYCNCRKEYEIVKEHRIDAITFHPHRSLENLFSGRQAIGIAACECIRGKNTITGVEY